MLAQPLIKGEKKFFNFGNVNMSCSFLHGCHALLPQLTLDETVLWDPVIREFKYPLSCDVLAQHDTLVHLLHDAYLLV